MKPVRLFAMVGALIVAGCSGPGSLFGSSDPSPTPTPFEDDVADDMGPQRGPQPEFGETVSQDDPPPPLSGGTLIVSRAGAAVAADPDRDRVYIVDLASSKVITVQLKSHDEPGRLAEDGAGVFHVALRRGGDVVSIDATGAIVGRRAACPAPRGIAYDKTLDRLVVACEGGELVALTAAPDGAVSPIARLDRDLRDVVVDGDKLWVSRFRNAELLELDAKAAIVSRSRPDAGEMLPSREATLAWRTIASPVAGDPPIVLHELASTSQIEPQPGGYGAPPIDPQACPTATPMGGIIDAAITTAHVGTAVLPSDVVLPLDIAADETRYLIVAAGNAHTPSLPQIFEIARDKPCGVGVKGHAPAGQAIAVALRPGGFLVQSREPAQLVLMPEGKTIALASESREDTGHAIFHSNSGSGLACASCHGEGGDDAHVWRFDTIGERRTPSLRGTLAGTAPYHWGGEMADVSHLVDDVLTGRMNGPSLAGGQKSALQSWLFAMPAPAPASGIDAASAARGKTLFESSAAQCASCHNGDKLTNSATVDVGTGGSFQVPSLVGVAARAPFLHAGCATTLEDRFGASCATEKHGKTTSLTPADITDLVAYLSTL